MWRLVETKIFIGLGGAVNQNLQKTLHVDIIMIMFNADEPDRFFCLCSKDLDCHC